MAQHRIDGTLESYRGINPERYPNVSSFGERTVVTLSAPFDITAAGAIQTDHDVTGLTLTLSPGKYRIGFRVVVLVTQTYVRVKLTDAANVIIGDSVVVTGSSSAITQGETVSAEITIDITTTTTYKLRAATSANNTAVIEDDSWLPFPDPDSYSIIYAERVE